MENGENNLQYPLEPKMKNQKGQGFWSRLTVKKKGWLLVALVVAVVVVAAVVYFVLAAARPTFRVSPDSGNWLPGNTYSVEVYVEGGDVPEEAIHGFDMNIRYTDSIFTDEANQIDIIPSTAMDDTPGTVASHVTADIDRGTNTIHVQTNDNLYTNFVNENSSVLVLTVEVVVPAGASGNFELRFIDDKRTVWVGNIGTTMIPDIDSGMYIIGEVGPNSVFLNPAESDYVLGEEFEIDVMMAVDPASPDIVAVAFDLEYDDNVLNVANVLSAPQFPVSGDESNTAGTYRVVRGTYGDGDPNNGTRVPVTTRTGFKGAAEVVATIVFESINIDTGTVVSISNLRLVADDGAGTYVTGFSGMGGNYTIIEEPPFAQNLIILNPGYSCVQTDTNQYDLSVFWETNLPASSRLSVNGSEVARTPESTGDVVNHFFTTPVGQIGTSTLSSTDDTGDSFELDLDFDCSFNAAELQIVDLIVTPNQGGTADIVFMTVGGANGGVADGSILLSSSTGNSLGSYSPASTPDTNVHRYRATGLDYSTDGAPAVYELTVSASSENVSTGVDDTATETVSFVMPADLGEKGYNKILKVIPDRVCDNWLYCRSGIQVVNSRKKTENLCYEIGLCERVDENGECISSINPGSQGFVGGNQTFESPYAAAVRSGTDGAATAEEMFKNLSGMSRVGMYWGECTDNPAIACDVDATCVDAGAGYCKRIEGYKHYAVMSNQGKNVNVANGDFELGSVWPWQSNGAGVVDVTYDVYNSSVIAPNHVLRISNNALDTAATFAGARVPLGLLSSSDQYVLSLDIRSSVEGKVVRIQARTVTNVGSAAPQWRYSELTGPIILNSGTTNIVQRIDRDVPEGYTELIINQTRFDNADSESFNKPFFIDNVSMKSVLHAQNAEGDSDDLFIARSCRMYPGTDAPACDYNSGSGGKQYIGWKGFCVEDDPGGGDLCLNWYPVDILPGETSVFSSDNQVGYTGKKPLYYCLESAGNYPYKKVTRTGGSTLMYGICDVDSNWAGVVGGYVVGSIGVGGLLILPGPATIVAGLAIDYIADQMSDDQRICGWEHASGRQTTRAPDEVGLREIEIDKIVLEPLCEEGEADKHCFSKKENPGATLILNRDNDWQDYLCTGGNCQAETYYKEKGNLWGTGVNMLNNNDKCAAQGVDFFATRAVFYEGEFAGIQTGLCNTGEEGFVRYKATFYLTEPCNVIAQVVDPYGANYAWSSRILKNGWLADNDLGYSYDQDYTPYGSVVTPPDSTRPEMWDYPVYVEPIDRINFPLKPYQARAGSPYGIKGDEIGSMCISGNPDKIGKKCKTHTECGYDLSGGVGYCVGIDLTDAQKEKIGGGYIGGAERLSSLFVKGLAVWYWYPSRGKYVQTCSYNYSVAAQCSGPDEAECLALTNMCWDNRDDYLFQRPSAEIISLNEKDKGEIRGSETVGVEMRFTTKVNPDQLPLRAFRVYWGDGDVTEVTNLAIAPRNDEDNPHVVVHTYTEPGTYYPKVQIEDNWGLCSLGSGPSGGSELCPIGGVCSSSVGTDCDGNNDCPVGEYCNFIGAPSPVRVIVE